MSSKPVFVATHPRACSTAFERVFMTCRDSLACVHEPFGDAFYYGPERLSERFADDKDTREKSGFSNTTYADVLRQIEEAGDEDKRVFIKDIAYYLFPPDGKPPTIAPSFGSELEANNPTVIPTDILKRFQFTFLIRHPRYAIPSYFRCTVPPLVEHTGFHDFMANEAGYAELRRLFDYLLETDIVSGDNVVVLDADDMLDFPEITLKAFCEKAGLDFSPSMLQWSEDDTAEAEKAFEKWKGFHEDALESSSLKPRSHAHVSPTIESEDKNWEEKYGAEAQKLIRACVDASVADYEHLKGYALKF